MIGQIVEHSRYGRGAITDYQPPYMMIRFEQLPEEKRFAYPMAFERFLRFSDESMQEKARDAIAAIQDEARQKAETQAEALRLREAELIETRKAELKAKRAAAAKKAAGTRAVKRAAKT